MGYFPFFVDISSLCCMVIGGGKVALRKIEKLYPFGGKIKLVSPEVCDEILKIHDIEIIYRRFEPTDLDGTDFVISATDDKNESDRIFKLCTQRKIPINTVDDKEKCTFLFPALISKNDVTVGISTSGQSPVFAKSLKKSIEPLLDEKNLEAVKILGKYRPLIKEKIRTSRRRSEIQERLIEMLSNDTKIDDAQIKSLIEEFSDNEA